MVQANKSKSLQNSSIGDNTSLTPKGIVEFLKAAVRANQPCFVWGPPGVAKSALMRVVARDMGFKLYDFRALMRDVVDLNGIPSASESGHTQWLRPNWLPELTQDNKDERGILLLDELNAAPPAMQAVCYQIVHDRQAGEHVLHPGWLPMAAGNNDTDGAVTSKMPTPLKSRFLHLNIGMDELKNGERRLLNQGYVSKQNGGGSTWCNDWLEWASSEGDIHPLIQAYHKATSGANLYVFNKNTQTFPCLRTWEFVSKILKASPPSSMLFPLIAGCIGEGYASNVHAFIMDAQNIPDLDDLLKNPDTCPIPVKNDRKYALVSMLASKLNALETKEFNKLFSKAMIYINRLDPEFQVLIIQDIYDKKKDELRKHPDMLKWCCGEVGALMQDVMKMDRVSV